MLREKVSQFKLRNKSRSRLDNDPQLLRMLKEMEERGAQSSLPQAATLGDKVRISLSDTEFDKY
jgi:hypothetical protein